MQIPRPAPGRAPIWVVATIGLIVLTVGAVWWGLAATVGKPNWMDLTWEITDDNTMVVHYQVAKPTDQTVRCLILAQGPDHAAVGSTEVTLGPDPQQQKAYATTVRTTSRAVRGGVDSCRAVPAR
ncbi:hypothetical protein KEM60_01846 [Austwickia sp. TVS 96-490-7B]|uniref:DUF4307 domain-containing protein n=1 Tax=Austwickia sp. TVS 96-490-7B TaxID=2830843 RepID=UPI001C55C8B6|nr:DUF4307 domain-containing protein [Austwickia sp. TVS 96-490-7B]MBW3085642.1 hypothetical protein [Austwickia sp. TVS 96-490-7B]